LHFFCSSWSLFVLFLLLFSLYSLGCISCICLIGLVCTFFEFSCSYFAVVRSFIALIFPSSLYIYCAFLLHIFFTNFC
jgi:hypothetical protein